MIRLKKLTPLLLSTLRTAVPWRELYVTKCWGEHEVIVFCNYRLLISLFANKICFNSSQITYDVAARPEDARALEAAVRYRTLRKIRMHCFLKFSIID